MRKFLSFLLLGLLLSVGNVWADSYTITFKETGTGSDASTKRTTNEDIISTGDTYVSSISNATNVYNARTGRGIKLGTSSAAGSLTLNLASPVTPTKITFRARQYSNSETTITVNSNTVTNLTTSVDEYTINYDGNTSVSSIAISTPEKRAYITEVTVYYGVVLPTCATPTFTPTEGAFVGAQSVAINCATEGATIYYTTNGSNPTTSSSVYSSAISVSETTTIKAIAAKDGYNNSSVASATYTITQPLTTMDEIFAKATAVGGTATDVVVTFNNWIVTGIKGSNAYVTDGTKGFIIYQSNHGFSVGDILSGTASCKVQLSYPEISRHI